MNDTACKQWWDELLAHDNQYICDGVMNAFDAFFLNDNFPPAVDLIEYALDHDLVNLLIANAFLVISHPWRHNHMIIPARVRCSRIAGNLAAEKYGEEYAQKKFKSSFEDKLYNLEMGNTLDAPFGGDPGWSTSYTRVPGGWLYKTKWGVSDPPAVSLFLIPFVESGKNQ